MINSNDVKPLVQDQVVECIIFRIGALYGFLLKMLTL